MSTTESYDFLVFGCGTAGKHLAWSAAEAGHKTAVIERGPLGGASQRRLSSDEECDLQR
jgi:pyruvate/2-oxoglutarate dehydrogenase complex dihydrolipoamide dehydrogenase (E3) component